MPDPVLREKARDLLRRGYLPRRRYDRTWAGPGTGAACSLCGVPIGRQELEMEVELEPAPGDAPGPRPSLRVDHFHRSCFEAWEQERDLGEA